MLATLLIPVYLTLIFCVPVAAAALPVLLLQNIFFRTVALTVAPLTFAWAFVTLSGLLSLPFQRAIVPGKFLRSLKDPVYGPRRVYGLCWTAVFYFSPLYYCYLSMPSLKKYLFRLFGYRGSTRFTVYPDTWIRDLPALRISDDVYISNKATVGTNLCLKSGHIYVDHVTLDKGALIGHMAMLAPGTRVGESAEIGVGVALGIRTRVGRNSKVCPTAAINHGVDIGADCEIGSMSYIGLKAVVRDGIKVPPGANVPAGAVINNQDDLKRYLSSETDMLRDVQEQMAAMLAKSGDPGMTNFAIPIGEAKKDAA